MAYDRGLADRVRTLLIQTHGFSERKMFGGIAFLIDEHMCCGAVKTDIVLRLAANDVPAALRSPDIRPMDFTGKQMKSMIYLSAEGSDSDDVLQEWVEAALAYVRTLPAKSNGRI